MARPLVAPARRPQLLGGLAPALHGVDGLLGFAHGLLGAAAGGLRVGATYVWARRRLRLAGGVTLLVLALLAGGWLWLRSSPLSAVRDVRIVGVHGPDAARIDAALTAAARGMSTLNVNHAALRAAVAPLHLVRALSVTSSFPHRLRISVVEQLPVAELLVAGSHTAVAADGVVLGPALLGGQLPTVQTSGPAPVPGQRVAGAATQAELAVLGATPRVLLGWIQRLFTGPEGLTVQMRGGLPLYFGNATRPHAKWLAAARVLADPGSADASYIDVRLPERPAAGFGGSGAGTAGGSTESSAAGVGASDPNAAALAAKLDEAVSGGSSASAAATSGALPGSATGAATTGASAAAPSESSSASGGSSTATTPTQTGPSGGAPGEAPGGTVGETAGATGGGAGTAGETAGATAGAAGGAGETAGGAG